MRKQDGASIAAGKQRTPPEGQPLARSKTKQAIGDKHTLAEQEAALQPPSSEAGPAPQGAGARAGRGAGHAHGRRPGKPEDSPQDKDAVKDQSGDKSVDPTVPENFLHGASLRSYHHLMRISDGATIASRELLEYYIARGDYLAANPALTAALRQRVFAATQRLRIQLMRMEEGG